MENLSSRELILRAVLEAYEAGRQNALNDNERYGASLTRCRAALEEFERRIIANPAANPAGTQMRRSGSSRRRRRGTSVPIDDSAPDAT